MKIDSFMGYSCYFVNSSYNCPIFKLFGFSTEKSLHAAIKRAYKKIYQSTVLK